MKYIINAIAILLLTVSFSISCLAEDKSVNKGMGMEMSEAMKDKHARDKQRYILKINELSDRIGDEKNSIKKQALMDEQLQLIKDHLEQKRMMKKKMMKKHHKKMMKKMKSRNM